MSKGFGQTVHLLLVVIAPLPDAVVDGDRGVDFITIDGGEGGTGAGPLVFADHVALPFKIGFTRVHSIFSQRGIVGQL